MITKRRHLREGVTLWEAISPRLKPPSVKSIERHYDVVIIGAGISGALAAAALSTLDLSVLILDRRGPAMGSTAASTALIQWEIDQSLTALAKQVGLTKAKACYRASYLAVRRLQRTIRKNAFACSMVPRKTLLVAGKEMGAIELQREVALRKSIDLPSRFLDASEVNALYKFARQGAIESSGSLELNPRKLTFDLLGLAASRGTEVHYPADVVRIEAAQAGVFVTLGSGQVVAAAKLIVATGYETLPEIPKQKYKLISTWALATVRQVDAALWRDRALVWEASDPYLYFRTTQDGRIIVGGEDADFTNAKRRDALIARKSIQIMTKLGKLLPHAALEAEYSWAGTFAESPTGLPAIGPVMELPNVFAILGAGGNGITFSVIAAEIAKDWVCGKTHKDAALFAL